MRPAVAGGRVLPHAERWHRDGGGDQQIGRLQQRIDRTVVLEPGVHRRGQLAASYLQPGLQHRHPAGVEQIPHRVDPIRVLRRLRRRPQGVHDRPRIGEPAGEVDHVRS